MSDMEFRLVDHSDEVLRALEIQVEAALEAVGNQGVSHVKQEIDRKVPRNSNSWYTPKGTLMNSINHKVVMSEKAVYVGTDSSHAIYNEVGTGIYAEGGKGRKTPWTYVDDEGKGHTTRGMKPIHMIKNGIGNNIEELKQIVKEYLQR